MLTRAGFMKGVISLLFIIAGNLAGYAGNDSKINDLLTQSREAKSDTARIRLNLLIAKYHIFKPGENKADLDTAFTYLKHAEKMNKSAKDKRLSGHVFLIASYWFREKGKRREGKEYIDAAVAILLTINEQNLLGESYDELAQYFDYRTEIEAKVKAVSNAAFCFKIAGNLEREGSSRQMLGDLYSIQRKFDESNQELNRALFLFNKIKNSDLQGIYSLMSRNYNNSNDYHRAYKFGILGIKAANAVRDTTRQMYSVYDPVIQASYRLRDTSQTNYYFDKMLDVAEKYRDTSVIIAIGLMRVQVLFSMDQNAEAMRKLKILERRFGRFFSTAAEFRKNVFFMRLYALEGNRQLAKQYRDSTSVGYKAEDALEFMRFDTSLLAYLVEYHLDMSEPKLASEYLRLFRDYAQNTQNKRVISLAYRCQFRVDTANHQYKSAVKHLLTYRNYYDSLNVETAQKAANFIKFEYESDIKDQNIQILTNKNKIQQAELEHSDLVKNLFFSGAILLTVILGLLYNQFRIKRNANEEIMQKNLYQEKLLVEKEWLLKEIHHRVKNNLQTVMSLLESQSMNLKSDALSAIKDSQHRVQAMALIHQKLYLTDNVTTIDMRTYIQELVTYLKGSFNTRQHIQFNLDIEPIKLDLTQAIPLGLILNEAVTNSIKYAFPGDLNGAIQITMIQTYEDSYELYISDDGIGLPVDFEARTSKSLGMSLLKGLTNEIGGIVKLDGSNGTSVHISFSVAKVFRYSRSMFSEEDANRRLEDSLG